MKVTISVPESIVSLVQRRYRALTNGKEVCEDALVGFFKEDVAAVYFDHYYRDLDDAISCYFTTDVYGKDVA